MLQKSDKHSSSNEPGKNETNSIFERILSWNSLIVILLPFTGSLILYSYEFSRFMMFGLPLDLISIDTTKLILLSLLFLTLGSIITFSTAIGTEKIIKLTKIVGWPSRQSFVGITYILTLFLTPLALILYWGDIFFYVLLLFFIFDIIIVIYGVLRYYLKKDIKSYNLPHEELKKLRTVIAVFLMLYLPLISFVLGGITSRYQSEYYVAKIVPECVVLYANNERVICSPIDKEKREVEPAFKVLYYQDNQNMEFRRELVGPLHPQPTPTPTLTPTITNTPSPTLIPTSIPATVSPADT